MGVESLIFCSSEKGFELLMVSVTFWLQWCLTVSVLLIFSLTRSRYVAEFVGRHVEGGGAGICLFICVFRVGCCWLRWCAGFRCPRGIYLVGDVAVLLGDGVLVLLEWETVEFIAAD